YVPPNPIFFSLRAEIATTAARYAIPAVYGDRPMVEAGGLMSYGADAAEDWRLVGTYVGRILKGDKPADLPVLQPTKIDFVINMHPAGLLRAALPPTLLALTTEVIE